MYMTLVDDSHRHKGLRDGVAQNLRTHAEPCAEHKGVKWRGRPECWRWQSLWWCGWIEGSHYKHGYPRNWEAVGNSQTSVHAV